MSLKGLKGRVLMRQKEARAQIIREWGPLVSSAVIDHGGPTGRDTLRFFFELQDARSPLLDFQTRDATSGKLSIRGCWPKRGYPTDSYRQHLAPCSAFTEFELVGCDSNPLWLASNACRVPSPKTAFGSSQTALALDR